MTASKQIEILKGQIDQLHKDNIAAIRSLSEPETVEETIARVNAAGRKLFPEKYSTRVVNVYVNAETRNTENGNNLI